MAEPEEDEAGREWTSGITREWAAELEDPRQDIYTLDDGRACPDAELCDPSDPLESGRN
jgi:hypothetical protein